MLPAGRELTSTNESITIIQSSVLILIFPHHGEIHTCLIRRPTGMRNHGGQIAFPGGKFEPSDRYLSETAKRESFEEVGINPDAFEIIGALSPVYVQVSNYKINPFIGWCNEYPEFKIDNREVDQILILPIAKLVHPQTIQSQSVHTTLGTFDVPGFLVESTFIWGATAMIISEFSQLFRLLDK
jgi:8-oxo-dGTP pyrophosphatase MutT (NUDIX family)